MPINPLPKNFRGRYPASAIASYDHKDIDSGTGYNDYYLTATGTAGANTWILTDRIAPSSVIIKTVLQSADDDHDLTPFVLPKDIFGTALISWRGETDAGTWPLIFQLRRVRNGVETNISAQVTSNNADGDGQTNLTPIPITTLAHFGVGDILRLNIQNGITTGNGIIFGTDPANRDHPTYPDLDEMTTFILTLPSRI